jgi:hypothetical protein
MKFDGTVVSEKQQQVSVAALSSAIYQRMPLSQLLPQEPMRRQSSPYPI